MKVWNKRDPKCPKDAEYVGRPTVWGNPYSHMNVKGTIKVASRKEAIRRYEEDISERDRIDIRRWLAGKDLVCWCAPLPCHADVLLKIANKKGE